MSLQLARNCRQTTAAARCANCSRAGARRHVRGLPGDVLAGHRGHGRGDRPEAALRAGRHQRQRHPPDAGDHRHAADPAGDATGQYYTAFDGVDDCLNATTTFTVAAGVPSPIACPSAPATCSSRCRRACQLHMALGGSSGNKSRMQLRSTARSLTSVIDAGTTMPTGKHVVSASASPARATYSPTARARTRVRIRGLAATPSRPRAIRLAAPPAAPLPGPWSTAASCCWPTGRGARDHRIVPRRSAAVSIVAIIPVANLAAARRTAGRRGYGPNNFSVAAYAQPTPTHAVLHAWSTGAFATAGQGVARRHLHQKAPATPVARTQALIAAQSAKWGAQAPDLPSAGNATANTLYRWTDGSLWWCIRPSATQHVQRRRRRHLALIRHRAHEPGAVLGGRRHRPVRRLAGERLHPASPDECTHNGRLVRDAGRRQRNNVWEPGVFGWGQR